MNQIWSKINQQSILAYQKKLADDLNLSPATVKRRVSSIRKFCEWANKLGYLEQNPFLPEGQPEKLKYTPNKVKLSLSNAYKKYQSIPITKYFHWAILIIFCAALGFGAYDQFFKKAPSPLAYPEELTPPNRFLSFQGRLTDSSDNPISGYTDITFKLWKVPSEGTEGDCKGDPGEDCLWTSSCTISSDQDGIFSLLLGTISGPECTYPSAILIPTSVFTENQNIYLGVKVASEENEMTPRIQVATVGYALNAETLQGYPPGTIAKSIPYINNAGDILIAGASPMIQATSGIFAIEGLTGVTIQAGTGVGGSITIAPKGDTGTVNLISQATTGNLLDYQGGTNFGTSGDKEDNNLFYGYVGNTSVNFNLLKLEAGTEPGEAKFTVDAQGNTSTAGTLKALSTAADALDIAGGIYAGSSDTFKVNTSGNITGGQWQSTAIAPQYGGTGQNWSGVLQGALPYFSSTGIMNTLGAGTLGYVLQANGPSANPNWADASSIGPWTLVGTSLYPDLTTYNVGIGSTGTPANKLSVVGNTDISGNLGVGTTNPGSYTLNVVGNTYLGGTLTTTGAISAPTSTNTINNLIINSGALSNVTTISMNNQFTNSYANSAAINLTGNGSGITFGSAGPYQIITGGSSNLALMPGGSLGIGSTSTPGSKLSVFGNASIGSTYALSAAPANGLIVQGNTGIGSTNPTSLFNVGASNQLAIDTSGNLSTSGTLTAATSNTLNGLSINSGTITAGTWNGNNIAVQYGGTGQNWASVLQGALPYFSGPGIMNTLGAGTAGYVLQANGPSADPTWVAQTGGTNYWGLTGNNLYPTSTTYNVGLGLTNPVNKLSVAGAVSIGSTYAGLTAPANSLIVQGNIGIGTTNPTTALQVVGATILGNGLNGSENALLVNTGASFTGNLLRLDVNSSQKFAIDYTGQLITASGIFTSQVADSGSAIGFKLVTPSYTTSGAKLFSVWNDTSEKFSVDKSGVGTFYGSGGSLIDNTLGDITINAAGGNISLAMDNLINVAKIGIGRTVPSTQLDIAGDATISGTLSLAPQVQAYAGTCTASLAGKMYYNAAANKYYFCNSTDWVDIGTNYWALSGSNLYPNLTSYNVGIGTTSPDAKFHLVGGDAYLAPDTGYSFDHPSANEDLYVYGNLEVDGTMYGTLNGTFNPGFTQGSVIFQGASGLTVNPANFFWNDSSKYLGIGTSSPASNLDVAGTTNLRGAAGQTGLFVNSSGNVGIGTTNPVNKLSVSGAGSIGSTYASIAAPANGLIVQGNVGIGTTNPASALEVVGEIKGTKFTFQDSTNTYLDTLATDKLSLFTNSASRLTIDSSGNVGIGTTNPQASLSINGGLVLGNSYVGLGLTSPTNGVIIQGNVGIGTTTPGAKLDVTGSNTGKALAVFNETGTNDIFTASASGTTRLTLTNAGSLLPGTDDAQNIGTASARWQNVNLSDNVNIYGKYVSDSNYEVGKLTYDTLPNTDSSLDFQPADESTFSQEDLAYSTTLTPSATTGTIILTLGSGNWNANSKVKQGNRVVGNGGIATLTEAPGASSTITALVTTDFTNTDAIASGSWQLYGTKFSTLEQLVLNDFVNKKDFNTSGSGAIGYFSNVSVAQIDPNKVLITYEDYDNQNYGTAIVASVSGTTISYGTKAVFNAAETSDISVAKLDTNKALIAYSDYGNSDYGTAIVASVSGTTITYGLEYIFNSTGTYYLSAAQLTTDKAIIAYDDGGNSDYGTAIVASVSSTTISYDGSEAVFNSATTSYISTAQLGTNRSIITYKDEGNSNYGTAIVASVSGATITYPGGEAVFNSATTSYISTTPIGTDKALIAYKDEGNSNYGTAIVASVSGATITYPGGEAVFNSATTFDISTAQLGTDKALIAYSDADNSDYGTATVASVSGTTITYPGGEVVFNSAATSYLGAVQLTTDKAIIAYKDEGNSNYGTATVASVSGTTITYPGGEVVFNLGAKTNYTSVVQIDPNKVLIAYQDGGNSNYGTAIVASVSDTAITYGSEAVFNSAETSYISTAKLTTNKAIIAYSDEGNSDYGTATVASVSGTTITYPGGEVVFNSATTGQIAAAQLTTDKAIIAYNDIGNSSYGTATVASVSGTTITYPGGEVVFNLATTGQIAAAQLTTDKAIIAYSDNGNSDYGTATVASVSGTTITYPGGEVVFNSATTYEISATQLTTDKALIAYSDDGNSDYGTAIVASVSGTTITYPGGEVVFNLAASYYISTTQLDTDKALIAYDDNGNSDYGTTIVASVTGTTISYGSETVFNSGTTEYISAAKFNTDRVFVAFNYYTSTQANGEGIVVNINATANYTSNYPTSTYYTTSTTDSNQLDASLWSDINSGIITETLSSQTIHYAVSFDDRTTWKIYDTTVGDSGWRPIARNNSSIWQYNSNTTAGATDITWTAASTNTQFGALDQAFQVTANQMTGTNFNAIGDLQWEETGGFVSGTTTKLDFAFGLKTTSVSATPALSQITIALDYSKGVLTLATQSIGGIARPIKMAVGSTDAMFIDTTGNIGIGTTSSSYKLDVAGTASFNSGGVTIDGDNYVNAARFVDTAGEGNYFVDPAASGTSATFFGNVGIGTTSPAYKLVVIDPSYPTLPSALATIVAFGSTTGLTTGVSLRARGSITGGLADIGEYVKVIGNPDDYQQGDLMRVGPEPEKFSKTQIPYDPALAGIISDSPGIVAGGGQDDLTQHRIMALAGQVAVKIASSSAEIKIGDYLTSSEQPGKAMRAEKAGPMIGKALEDWDCFPEEELNTGLENEASSSGNITTPTCKETIMLFINFGLYDPDVFLTDSGDLRIISQDATYSGLLADENNFQFPISNFQSISNDSIFKLVNQKTGEIIQKIGAFSELIAANIRAGRIETQGLISPVAEIGEIKTQRISLAEISPATESGNIVINLQTPTESSESAFGRLIIKGKEGQEVASIDSQGNATFAGTLSANEATITGTLYADEIITKHGKFGDLLAASIGVYTEATRGATSITQNITNIYQSATESAGLEETASPSAILSEEEIEALVNEILASSPEATSQAVLAENISLPPNTNPQSLISSDGLTVLGNTSLADTTIAGSLNIGGTLALADSSINSLSGTLYLNSLGLGGIDILAGKIVIDSSGNLTVSGDVTVKGNLAANTLRPLPEQDLVIDLANAREHLPGVPSSTPKHLEGDTGVSSGFGKLLVKGTDGQTVASIDASGSATFAKLNIATANASQSTEIITPTEIKTNATAGQATLPANEMEITIKSPFVTENTLIYITSISSTENKVLYVKAKKATENTENTSEVMPGWFKVAIDTPINKEIKFNWWIVN